jgi:hypothetical protein
LAGLDEPCRGQQQSRCHHRTLKEIVLATKNAVWAYRALRNIRDLTEAQRAKLCDVIAATKDAYWAYWA